MYNMFMPKKTQAAWLSFFKSLHASEEMIEDMEYRIDTDGIILEDELIYVNEKINKTALENQLKHISAIFYWYATTPYTLVKSEQIIMQYLESVVDEFGTENVACSFEVTTNEPCVDVPKALWSLEGRNSILVKSIEITRATGSELNLVVRVDVKQKDFGQQKIEVQSESTATVESNQKVGEAKLRLDGRKLVVSLPNNDEVIFNVYKLENGPHNFMKYLFQQPDGQQVNVTSVLNVEGCEDYKDLQIAARTCGFDKLVKPIFFPLLRQDRLIFAPLKSISAIEQASILKNAKKNEEKRKKTKVK